ncbi:DUF986 family protein [uncultured Parabacteroides sp.]|uniref:DUF986 family protein n=1 Tax=Parabacteroides sp. ASD2025 TaxID=3415987 RepID=UPI0026598ABD|nr:DUF986 family protein [uncultured Parabacteroides sp.]
MEDHQSVDDFIVNMELYEAHFLPEFPRLKLVFREKGFTVHGTKIRYTDIRRMKVDMPNYLVVEMKKGKQLFLPLQKRVSYKEIAPGEKPFWGISSLRNRIQRFLCFLSD